MSFTSFTLFLYSELATQIQVSNLLEISLQYQLTGSPGRGKPMWADISVLQIIVYSYNEHTTACGSYLFDARKHK